ncbi:MAG: type II toxin-antitoxin system HicA family toxin [Dehalococcoidales bacterium]|nr:type II toxin-antitoxin system HicA family toxin [Dehalococcoidales bacterium]
MTRLTPISWKEFAIFLENVGCYFDRQEGDHLIYKRTGLKRPIVLPKMNDIPVFIILNNLRILGVSRNEYLKLINKR